MLQSLLGLARARSRLATTLTLGVGVVNYCIIGGKMVKAILFYTIFVKVPNIFSMIVHEKFSHVPTIFEKFSRQMSKFITFKSPTKR